MLNMKVVSVSLGISTAFSFVLCIAYGLAMPDSLHMHVFLEQVLPGFEWLSWTSFLLGLAESFLYGAYAGLVYVPVYSFFQERWGRT